MTNQLEKHDDASTPLTEEEREALILTYIIQRTELNEAEQANILEAEVWASSFKRDVLEEKFLKNLHKRMFGRVWKWAGTFRKSARNIGVVAYCIPSNLRQLINEASYWIENKIYHPDEIAAWFHHRLVYIHPFPNGNGRHARLAADLLLVTLGRDRFSWGRFNLVDTSETRITYINALRAADNHDIRPLLGFVRS